jgi:hypothetical protein
MFWKKNLPGRGLTKFEKHWISSRMRDVSTSPTILFVYFYTQSWPFLLRCSRIILCRVLLLHSLIDKRAQWHPIITPHDVTKKSKLTWNFTCRTNRDWAEMDGTTDSSVCKHKDTYIICFALPCRPVLWVSVFANLGAYYRKLIPFRSLYLTKQYIWLTLVLDRKLSHWFYFGFDCFYS